MPRELGRTSLRATGEPSIIAWMYGAGPYPGMPFSDQLTFPCTFTLQTCPEGLRVCRTPIREIEKLYDQVYQLKNIELSPESKSLSKQLGEMLDIEMEIEVKDASAITLEIRRHPLGCGREEKRNHLQWRIHASLDRRWTESACGSWSIARRSRSLPTRGRAF